MAKRRPSGDGMVRQKKKGQWEGRIVVGHKEDGSPIFRYVYAKTQKELLQNLHQKIDEYKNTELTEESSMTLGEWLDKWLRDFLPGTIRQTTLDGYRRNIKNYIKPNLGDAKLAFITTNDIQKMYNKLKKNGRIRRHPDYGNELADSTVIKIHTTLHSAMEAAVKNHLIQKNPTDGTKLPKKKQPSLRILNDAEIDTLIKAIEDNEIWGDFFYTELTTGLRRGEGMALQWNDINFKTGQLHITRQAYRAKGKLRIADLKTTQSERTIILPKSLINMLKEYKEIVNSRWVFPSPVKEDIPRDPNTIYSKMQLVLERAGCKKVRFHDLRHTFATTAIENGMDVKTLSEIMGHVSSKTALDIYLHSTDAMKKQAANKIDRHFGKKTPTDKEITLKQQEKPPQSKFEPTKGKIRKRGTGCISKINDHLYEGRYSPKGPDGKRISKNVYAKTKEECEAKLAELIKTMRT